jgi:hypothetical protein
MSRRDCLDGPGSAAVRVRFFFMLCCFPGGNDSNARSALDMDDRENACKGGGANDEKSVRRGGVGRQEVLGIRENRGRLFEGYAVFALMPAALRLSHSKSPKTTVAISLAEREGFEPSVRLPIHMILKACELRPLGHLPRATARFAEVQRAALGGESGIRRGAPTRRCSASPARLRSSPRLCSRRRERFGLKDC